MAQVTFTNGIASVWGAAYAEYKASLPPDKPAYHFYNFVYVTIYRDMRERAKAG